jgi:hypothetical protein
MSGERDLLGDPLPPMTPEKGRRKDPVPWGYFAPPGTGPAGETCGSCEHSGRRGNVAGTYYKCALSRARWTGGRKSDILLRSPACSSWKAPA